MGLDKNSSRHVNPSNSGKHANSSKYTNHMTPSTGTRVTNSKPSGNHGFRRGNGSLSLQERRLDVLASCPAVFMCLMTLIILLMDIFIPGMDQEQYLDYPAFFRIINICIVILGILFWIVTLHREGVAYLNPITYLNHCRTPDKEKQGSRNNAGIVKLVFIASTGLYLLCILISTAINGLDEKAVHGVSFRNIGVFHILAFYLIYLYLTANICGRKAKDFVLLSYIAVSDCIAASALIDRYIYNLPAFAGKKEISAIFFNGNHYGYFLTMAILISAGMFLYYSDRRIQLFGGLSMLLNAFILLLNHSMGCIIAVITVLLLLLIVSLFKNRVLLKRLFLVLAVFIVLGFAGLIFYRGLSQELSTLLGDLQAIIAGSADAGSAGHNRWMLWSVTAEYISQRPLFGYGCEGISDLLMDATGRANPHNELLSWAAFFGIPAAIFYLFSILSASAFWIKNKVWNDAPASCAALGACGYFISSLFGVPMFYTLPFFFVFLGLSLCRYQEYYS